MKINRHLDKWWKTRLWGLIPGLFAFRILTTPFSVLANPPTLEELSSNVFDKALIVWNAPTNQLPKSLWIYRRQLPHYFSATVISNAIVLGSLQSRGFPKPSTNDFFISEEKPPNYPEMIPNIFGIQPKDAYLYYSNIKVRPISEKQLPDRKTIFSEARTYAAQLGLAPTALKLGRIYDRFCDTNHTTNNICGRGVLYPRYLDGIGFFSLTVDGEGAEGFSVEFGEHGKVQAFFVRWSGMDHYKREEVAEPKEIVHCIKAHKALVLPSDAEDYFANLKKLAEATKFTITKITPYYGEGVFDEVPTNDVPCQFATPFAVLDGIADFENSNAPIQMVSPILSSEVRRLTGLTKK